MTTQEKRRLYESIMRDVSKVIKNVLEEYSYGNEDDFEQIVSQVANAFKKFGTDAINKKRVKLLILNEDIDSVRNNVLAGNSPLGKLDWQEIASRTIDIANGTADALINNTLAEVQTINRASSEQFKFDKWQFCIVTTGDNIKYVDFVFPDDEKLKQKLVSYMTSEGFYYNDAGAAFVEYLEHWHSIDYYPTEEEIEVLSGWTLFRFFPVTQENIIDTIKANTDYLIHLTPDTNVDNILANGLECHNDSHSTYPQRVFLIVPNRQDRIDWQHIKMNYPLRNYITALITRLNEYRRQNGQRPTAYKSVIIDINKLPNDTCLYIDTPSYPYAVYTEQNIPADCIERIESIEEAIKEFS